jgi:chromate transporter
VLLSSAYSQASNNPHIVHALAGMASVSGGVLLGTGFKMVRKAKLDITGFVFVGAGFVAVAAFHVPMIWVLLALLPVSIGSAWLKGIPS